MWVGSAIAWLLLVAVWFSPVWAGGKVLAPLDIQREMLLPWRGNTTIPKVHNHFVSDAVTQYLPYRWFADRAFREDGYIGWNPLNYGGTPQYANTMGTYADWTIQLHRWLPFWSAWDLGLFLQFLVAGWGMLALLRSRGIGPLIALWGAIAFGANFQFVAWIYHRWALGSFCWMPWAVWAFGPLLGRDWRCGMGRLPARVALAPAFVALAFLGGSLQHSAFIVLGVGCLWAAAAVPIGRDAAAQFRCLVAFAAIGLLATGAALFALLPCSQTFLANQEYGRQAAGWGYPLGPLQPFFNLAAYPAYLFPWPMGSPETVDLWKGFRSDLFMVPYIGFIPGVLAIAAFFLRAAPLAARLLIAAGLLIPLTPLVAPLYQRIFLLAVLGTVWAAAETFAALDRQAAGTVAKWSGRLLIAGAGIWTVLSLALVAGGGPLRNRIVAFMAEKGSASQFGATFPDWVSDRATKFLEMFPIWSPGSAVPLLLAIAGVAALSSFAGGRFGKPALALCAIILVTAELTLFASRWVTFSQPSDGPDLFERPPAVDIALVAGPDARLLISHRDPASTPFAPNTLNTFGIATAQGYDSVHDRVIDGIMNATPSSNDLGRFGITAALLDESEQPPRDKWREAGRANGLILWMARFAAPRYSTEGTSAQPEVLKSTASRRVLAAPAGATAIRVAENWHGDWRWRTGDQPWRRTEPDSDGSIRIAPLTAASWNVEMRFIPALQRWPGWVSAGCWIAMAGLAAGLRFASRPSRITP